MTEIIAEAAEDRLGMTEEQWAQWQAYTRGYGEQDENGIDISLLRQNLRLTPWERLRQLQSAANFVVGVRRKAKPDFLAIFQVLEAGQVRFVLIGAAAMCLHGSAYVTQNVDICVADEADSQLAFETLVVEHNLCLRAFPVSFLGVGSFDCLWARSVCFDVCGTPIPAADVDDLIAMKLIANRYQDKLHLMELYALRKLIRSQMSK